MRIIDRIVSPLGRRVDESSPMVDARLPDGSRVNIIIPPLSLIGPCISIRKFSRAAYTGDDMVRLDTMPTRLGGFPARLRAGAPEHRDLRRHLHRQDDAAQRPFQLSARGRAHRHHRGRGRAAAQQAPSGAAGGPPAQRGGQGRSQNPPTGHQRAAHASRPHRRRRSARRRGAGHAAGHEHRPRRLADHGPLQQPAGHAAPRRDHGADGGHGPAAEGGARADRLGLRPRSCTWTAWWTAPAR